MWSLATGMVATCMRVAYGLRTWGAWSPLCHAVLVCINEASVRLVSS